MRLNAFSVLGLLLTAGTPTGCQTTITDEIETLPLMTIKDFCEGFSPIEWSKHDTPETQKQIIDYNQAWDELCL